MILFAGFIGVNGHYSLVKENSFTGHLVQIF
jgi:hypothetical protein